MLLTGKEEKKEEGWGCGKLFLAGKMETREEERETLKSRGKPWQQRPTRGLKGLDATHSASILYLNNETS